MWYLYSIADPDKQYHLLVGREYVIGRKNCFIDITEDRAVSRKHAVITVEQSQSVFSSNRPIVKIQDVSKFGTFLNKNKIKSSMVVQAGDEIIFGSPKSAYSIQYKPLVVTSSCLNPVTKKKLQDVMASLDGCVVNEWNVSCSYLVMSQLNVTVKVVCALICQCPVVTLEYLEKLSLSMKNKEAPKAEEFLPPLAELQLEQHPASFEKIKLRKTLFHGKKFIFLNSKQFKKLKLAVELAGGHAVLLEGMTANNDDDSIFIESSTLVMCTEVDVCTSSDKWLTHVQAVLKRYNKRMIPDAELGYAVLYCSTEKYCNPDINAYELFRGLPSQSLSYQPGPLLDAGVLDRESSKRLEESYPLVKMEMLEKQTELKEEKLVSSQTVEVVREQISGVSSCYQSVIMETHSSPETRKRKWSPKLSVKEEKLESVVEKRARISDNQDEMRIFVVEGETPLQVSSAIVKQEQGAILVADTEPSFSKSLTQDSELNKRKKSVALMFNKEDKEDKVHTTTSPAPLQNGFLTARLPIKDQISAARDYVKDETLPSACLVVDFKALLVKKLRLLSDSSSLPNNPEHFVRWKGKLVRNYKKFTKSSPARFSFLPHIIDGNELEVHSRTASKEMEDLLIEAQLEESQKNELDRRAKELFNWEPPKTKGKKCR